MYDLTLRKSPGHHLQMQRRGELVAWVEDLEPKQFEGIEQFFTTMPKLSHTIQVTNPETKVVVMLYLRG